MEKEIIRYIDLIKYIEFESIDTSKSIDKLISRTLFVLPKSIKNVFSDHIDNKEFITSIGNKPTNKKSYNTFCFNILNVIANKFEIKTCYINEKQFIKTSLSLSSNVQSGITRDKIITDNCAFILKNKATNLIFNFGHQDPKNLQKLSNHIYSLDKNQFKNIHIVIFKNSKELDEARHLKNSNLYKRCFFTSFNEICTKAIEIDKSACEKIFSPKWEGGKGIKKKNNTAGLLNVEIIDNIPVGKEGSKLYKLTFTSEDTIDIFPGQFIMVHTLKEQKETSNYDKPKIHTSISAIKPGIHNNLGTNQISFLKRPFGIYRTYYENFSYDYLSKLSIEKELAAFLYTVKPNKFEILYKVLERGIGTNELTKLVKADKVEILAPLGKVVDIKELIKEHFDEIHIIGGGVGIAPLVNIAQTLRHCNIKVKAFVGVEDYNSLIYKDVEAKSYTDKSKNAKIYIDDLKYIGLSEDSDIYVSFLCNTNEEYDIKNLYKGNFVTEPYTEYLKEHKNLKILTFTCGPEPMMKKVHDLTAQYNVKSYVLMEKRMACGIGVCFSCVCKTIVNGENYNSRVCIDGPIIESKQINWNE